MSRVRSRPKPDRRRALELLAASRDGCTEAILLAHGFTIKQIVELVRAGLAAAHSQRVVIGRRTVEIARVKITEAGRQGLFRLETGPGWAHIGGMAVSHPDQRI